MFYQKRYQTRFGPRFAPQRPPFCLVIIFTSHSSEFFFRIPSISSARFFSSENQIRIFQYCKLVQITEQGMGNTYQTRLLSVYHHHRQIRRFSRSIFNVFTQLISVFQKHPFFLVTRPISILKEAAFCEYHRTNRQFPEYAPPS